MPDISRTVGLGMDAVGERGTPVSGGRPADGDPFQTMSEDHELTLFRSALQQCRNAADAWDLVQEVFERALRKRPPVKNRDELRCWLMVVLHNAFLDACRAPRVSRRAVIDVETIPAAGRDEDEDLWRTFELEEVLPLIPQLGSRLRDVFEPYIAGERVSAIAKRLELPASKVSARLFRARRQIREILLRRIVCQPGPKARLEPQLTVHVSEGGSLAAPRRRAKRSPADVPARFFGSSSSRSLSSHRLRRSG